MGKWGLKSHDTLDSDVAERSCYPGVSIVLILTWQLLRHKSLMKSNLLKLAPFRSVPAMTQNRLDSETESGCVHGDMEALPGRGRWKDEKEMVAALVRRHTALADRWVAARLGMGHEVSVTRAVRRFREDPKAARRLKALERKLGIC